MLAAQRQLLDDALADLDDERPDVTDLYFVGFAGDARDDVFRKDVLAAQNVMDERWDTDGRSLALINNPRTLLETPMATLTNLRETLNEIGATIDAEEDVVMVYLASHGSRDHVLEVHAAAARARSADGARAERPARRCGDQVADRRGVGVLFRRIHRCAAGRLHAGADGFAGGSHVVRLRQRERVDVLRRGVVPARARPVGLDPGAFETAKARVAQREQDGGFKPPSNPQIYVGPAMEDKLQKSAAYASNVGRYPACTLIFLGNADGHLGVDVLRSASRPFSKQIGDGGQPTMCRSTGRTAPTPPTQA